MGFALHYGFTPKAVPAYAAWLKGKVERLQGTTHEIVSHRFKRERPHLASPPAQPFDTSYRLYRKVYKDCTIRFEGNSYVVPHTLVGEQVILRVKDQAVRIFLNDLLVVTYEIPFGKGHLVPKNVFLKLDSCLVF